MILINPTHSCQETNEQIKLDMTVLIEIPQNSPDKVNHNIIHLPLFFLNYVFLKRLSTFFVQCAAPWTS